MSFKKVDHGFNLWGNGCSSCWTQPWTGYIFVEPLRVPCIRLTFRVVFLFFFFSFAFFNVTLKVRHEISWKRSHVCTCLYLCNACSIFPYKDKLIVDMFRSMPRSLIDEYFVRHKNIYSIEISWSIITE